MKLGPKRFVVGAIILLIVLDILNSVYLRLYWVKKDLSMTLVRQMFQRNGYLVESFSKETITEMTAFVDNTFYFFLLIVLINNLFFYVFYYRKKLWAQGFVLFYTLTAALFAVTFLFDDLILGWGWFLYNITTTLVYAYLFFGVKVLKYETTDCQDPNPSPAHETTAQ